MTARLWHVGDFTIFACEDEVIRFRTSSHLERYTEIMEWDRGYIVVMAKYDNSTAPEEEYIDLIPILENLCIDQDEFLNDIKEVVIDYERHEEYRGRCGYDSERVRVSPNGGRCVCEKS